MKRLDDLNKIGVIGLGYVGLPLACLFSSKYRVVGFDLNEHRVAELRAGNDSTHNMDDARIQAAVSGNFVVTSDERQLKGCDVFVVAVPTPVNDRMEPDTSPLQGASKTVGRNIAPGGVVVYESTVYPGLTEEFCLPIVEKVSGLKLNRDFFGGYSPERINPGDNFHSVENIVKITSGSTPEAADFINDLYASVIGKGTHRASSIKVAEAAKAMENAQRDVNIAFMNEMTILLNKLGINASEVKAAASTKWNFLPFKPGLVGGHCISVDPYYLISKARTLGMTPQLLMSARNVNEHVSQYVVNQVVERMAVAGIPVKHARVLLLGFSYKSNSCDIRNTKVADIYREMLKHTDGVTVFDPLVNPEKAEKEYHIPVTTKFEDISQDTFDSIVMCTRHDAFLTTEWTHLENHPCIFYDLEKE